MLTAAGVLLAGCGASGHSTSATTTATRRAVVRHRISRPGIRLRATSLLRLPSARSGAAAAVFRGRLEVMGGLSGAGTSTSTVFTVSNDGQARTAAPLPGPVHDAAAAVVGGRLLLFGGGQFEGSDRIIEVAPGPPHLVGKLPQALSDLEAVTIGDLAYVVGGWNGSATNRAVYAVRSNGRVAVAGRLPLGLRYAAVGTLTGRVIVAGGELASGAPSDQAYAFDARSKATSRLPDLPVATDHAAGIVINGTFYVLGGLRDGSPSNALLAWRPGQRRWRSAGRLKHPLADAAAASIGGEIALAGGRDAAGKQVSVTLLGSDARR